MRFGRRRTVTGKRLLVAAFLVLSVPAAGWIGLRYVAAPWAVRRALAAAGLQRATFRLESVGLTGLRVVNLSVGTSPWLKAGTVDVAYSLATLASARVTTITMSDATWIVQVRDGSVEWGPTRSSAAGPPALDLPLDRIDVEQSTIRVIVNGHPYDLPMGLTLTSSASGGVQGRLRLDALGGAIEVDAHARTEAGALTLEFGTAKPVALNLESSGFTGAVSSGSGRLRIGDDNTFEGTLTLRGGSLLAGDAAVSDLEADIVIRSRHEIELTSLRAVVGDGGTLSTAPFILDPSTPVIRTRLSVMNLGLAEWLPLLSDHHATGEGRVSGSMDLAIDLATATLLQLSGTLAADPQHGFIQVTDANSLGALLDAQDPRFATDEVMGPIRDKIVAAFGDFAFNTLTVHLSRQEDHTVARAYVSGYGRHGEDPQGLNVTLDLHVHDAIMDLASRMASLAKVKSAAGSALEQFFETTAPGERHP